MMENNVKEKFTTVLLIMTAGDILTPLKLMKSLYTKHQKFNL